MTSFAFVMGVLPMARATGAGAYSRNSLGIVIAFGIAVSTVLGRFVIPIYYVLGERLRVRDRPVRPDPATPADGDGHAPAIPPSPSPPRRAAVERSRRVPSARTRPRRDPPPRREIIRGGRP